MSLYGRLAGRGASGFGYASTAEEVVAGLDLSGRTYLVTGCNAGLGTETVRVLALRGARVIATARTEAKAADAVRGLPGAFVPLACELADSASVRSAVAAVRALGVSLDGIVANAGVMALPAREVAYGVELQLFTNHVGHFLLITGLLDRLTPSGRVVMVSSEAHRNSYPEGIRLDDLGAARGYTPWGAYGQSKLANLLFARHLAKRLPAGQTANAVHPGVIATNLTRHLNPALWFAWTYLGPALVMKSIPEGAATQVYVVAHPGAAGISGEYWSNCNVAAPRDVGRDDVLAERLWAATEAIVATLP